MDTPLPSFYVPSILFQSQSVCHVGLYYNKYETGTEESSVFTVFEGGLQTWPHRREAYYTWDGFCYGWPGKYHYIKYVKWPGAFPWERGMTVDHAQDPDALLKQVFRNLAQIVSDMIRVNVNRK